MQSSPSGLGRYFKVDSAALMKKHNKTLIKIVSDVQEFA